MAHFFKKRIGILALMHLFIIDIYGVGPVAFNIAQTIPKDSSINISVLPHVIQGSYPLNLNSLAIFNSPNHGTATPYPFSGVITYTPYSNFIGTDTFTYFVADTGTEGGAIATVYVTVVDPNKPCPTVCPTSCCKNECFDRVDECLCTEDSFANFTVLTGTWTQVGDHVHVVSGNLGNDPVSSFLRYQYQVSQAFEIIECDIEIPYPQLPNEPDCAVGLISHWNGSPNNNNGSSVVWFSYATDGNGNINGQPFFRVDTYYGGSQTNASFAIALDTTYKVTLIKVGQQTAVFIDNNFILLSPNSGSVAGNYIGMWSFRGIGNFKNFKSCSYTSTPPGFPQFNNID